MWTVKEMQKYDPREYKPLWDLYERAGLKCALPEKRAEYLRTKVLKLPQTDYEQLMKKAAKKGKPAALNLLEDMVIANLKEASEKK